MNSYSATKREPGVGLAIVAMAIAVIGICYPIPAYLELYNIRPGTACRPMGVAMAAFLSGIGSPVLTLIFASLASFRGRTSRCIAGVAAIFSLVPLPLYWWLFHWIVSAHSLILER